MPLRSRRTSAREATLSVWLTSPVIATLTILDLPSHHPFGYLVTFLLSTYSCLHQVDFLLVEFCVFIFQQSCLKFYKTLIIN